MQQSMQHEMNIQSVLPSGIFVMVLSKTDMECSSLCCNSTLWNISNESLAPES